MTNGFGEVVERLRRSTVKLEISGRWKGSGSGVIWSPDGGVITNAHVAFAPEANIELWDGRVLPARVTARDRRRDLAFLEVEAAGLPAASFGDSSALRVGELVVAVGNPLGFTGALTTGVVHSLGPIRGLGSHNWVRADVRLAPGNSGGPLADAHGNVIGINTMILRGLALAVPSSAIQDFVKRGASDVSLGVIVRPIPLHDGATVGLLLLEVEPGSPAAAASLLRGDILVAADGGRFRAVEDLGRALAESKGLLHLQFLRGPNGVLREVAVRPAMARAEAA